MSELVCVSVSHDTAPVAWGEPFAVPAPSLGAAAVALVRAGWRARRSCWPRVVASTPPRWPPTATGPRPRCWAASLGVPA